MPLIKLLMTQGEFSTMLATGFHFEHDRWSPSDRTNMLDMVRVLNGLPTRIFYS